MVLLSKSILDGKVSISMVTNGFLNEKVKRQSLRTSQTKRWLLKTGGDRRIRRKIRDTNLGASHDREKMNVLTPGRNGIM